MPHIRRFLGVLGAGAVLAGPAHADSSLQALLDLTTGYTDNVALAPEDSEADPPAPDGSVSSDAFANIAPGLLFAHQGQRVTQVLLYTLSLRLYAGESGSNSTSNSVAYGARVPLTPRSSVGIDLAANNGRMNVFDLAPQDTLVGSRPGGDESFQQASAEGFYSYQVARAWRFQHTLGGALFQPTGDSTQIDQRASASTSLGLTRIFNSHALTLGARGTYASYDQGEEAGMELGSLNTLLIGPELRWVHDLSEDFSTDAMIGAVAIMPAYEFDRRQQYPVGSAFLRYQHDFYGASIGYQRTVAPNIALGQTEVSHVAEARGVVPVPVRHRHFRDKLELSGAVGYSNGEFLSLRFDEGDDAIGDSELWVADLALFWAVSPEISAGLRYQRVWQDLVDPQLMSDETQSMRRQQILLTLQGRYPARTAAVLPRDPSTRVTGGLMGEEDERNRLRDERDQRRRDGESGAEVDAEK